MSTSLELEGQLSFFDPNWKPVKAGSFWPNRLMFNEVKRAAAIIIDKSPQGDFGLSQRALNYLIAAEDKRDKVDITYVVLREGGSQVGIEKARTIESNLHEVAVRDGKHGPYWWIDKSFKQPDLDDIPF